jgi:DNA mismatch repair protein MutS
VTRVVTPGTLTEDDLLEPRSSNRLLALAPASGGRVGLAWVDVAQGTIRLAEMDRAGAIDLIGLLDPAEVLVPDNAAGRTEALALGVRDDRLTRRPDWQFEREAARQALRERFGVTTVAGFGVEEDSVGVTGAGALVAYLRETLPAGQAHLELKPYETGELVRMDEAVARGLELVRAGTREGREGSLWEAIDRTRTAMGARLTRDWLLAPLAGRGAVSARHDAVEALLAEDGARESLRSRLKEIGDLERVAARAGSLRASPRDLAAVRRALTLAPEVLSILAVEGLAGPLAPQAGRIDTCPELAELLSRGLADDPPAQPGEGLVIRPGFDPEIDELRAAREGGKEWLARYQASEITRTGIPSLKVGYNSVFGYFIEITHANTGKVPPDYHRRQTLKNAERYITPELKNHEEKVLGAEERIKARELELFGQMRQMALNHAARLRNTAGALAELDALAGFAEFSRERGCVRPELLPEDGPPILEVTEGRHPVLEGLLPGGTLVPNDLRLGPDHGMLLLITGPNMGGKSVYLRQAGLMVVLAQAGCFVPAKSCRLALVDRVFTRIGAGDDLNRARSTFMAEMIETASILNGATARSLVLLDEIGRGTSTYDGVSLAWAICEDLHERVGCRTLCATHYHELAQLAERMPRARALRVEVRETAKEVLFLYRMQPGSTDKSYGIHVAARAGVPQAVVSRARVLLEELERAYRSGNQAGPSGKAVPAEPPQTVIRNPRLIQSSLFANTEDPVLEELRALDLSRVSPAEALELLARWRRELGGK